ncbi:alpha/beta hydrolase [Alcanivorax sp. 521-1]|uniref:Alpha/beta hydrolase n=1 Tax=Alloalcanivorax profundimaris TaxID=2735259 RepID=A0ABS0AST3_9GAMM|nr:alpha/beta fold hydrolase [Alloalcanivorax profundimaris]MBF5057194.1 alpha/beta hydrolase [Alloalcanivorax profundimaris]
MIAGEPFSVASGDYRVPLTWYPATAGAPVVVLMAALGVPARFYQRLAGALAERGFNVALMEQRGHGDSALRPSRRRDWGFAETLTRDLPALLDWLRDHHPEAPIVLMGHSLGGHYAAITAGRFPERVDGVVLVATGSPWVDAFAEPVRKRIRWLTRLIPVCNLVLGYYPGDRIGFGGREARTLMADWRDLALTNRYRARGLSQDLDAAIGGFPGPVLAVRLADDAFAPEAAVRAVTDKFRHATLTGVVLDAEALGDRADHFRWARQATTVADRVAAWHPDKALRRRA